MRSDARTTRLRRLHARAKARFGLQPR